jgi:hypothetical protein
MSNYIYFLHDQKRLWERFPDEKDIVGVHVWREYFSKPGLLLNKLRDIGAPTPDRACPRSFISHRQVDDLYALRIAEIATQCGFEYWVDVLDPSLRSLDDNPNFTKEEISILTACIIEMALINCSHVLTVMTVNTRGSQWVPYEYGRITEIPSEYERACGWRHPDLPKTDLPEYMDLGKISNSEMEISDWLTSEYYLWKNKSKSRICDDVQWKHGKKPKLPADK